MAEHQATWPVAVLCEVFEVSRSGFYAYVQRHASPTIDRKEVELVGTGESDCGEDGAELWQSPHGQATPGRGLCSRAVQGAAVDARGWGGGMPAHVPSAADHQQPLWHCANLLARQFDVEKPEQAWVGDIT